MKYPGLPKKFTRPRLNCKIYRNVVGNTEGKLYWTLNHSLKSISLNSSIVKRY